MSGDQPDPSHEPDASELEARYRAALEALRAEAKGLSGPVLQQRTASLKQLSRAVRRAKQKAAPGASRPAWTQYPTRIELPMSLDDSRFVQSFSIDNTVAAREFYSHFGFVVFHDILDSADCAASVAEIWTFLEERIPGLRRDDEETWDLLSSNKYGLPAVQAIFTEQIVANRQCPRLYSALDTILPRVPEVENWDSPHPSPNSVVISHDRWCMYRPTVNHPGWETPANLHLDVNPWSYTSQEPTDLETLRYEASRIQVCTGDESLPLPDFRAEISAVQGTGTGQHLQGVLNLLDNEDLDGGTCLVPCFHRVFPDWMTSLGRVEENLSQSSSYWVQPRAGGGGIFKFSNEDPIWQLHHRVPLRAGSLLLWNSLVVHGSIPNRSDKFRVAQFVRGFRAGEMTPDRAWARAAAIDMHLRAAGIQSFRPLAPHVFGVPRMST